jgi:hypothetical protein
MWIEHGPNDQCRAPKPRAAGESMSYINGLVRA